MKKKMMLLLFVLTTSISKANILQRLLARPTSKTIIQSALRSLKATSQEYGSATNYFEATTSNENSYEKIEDQLFYLESDEYKKDLKNLTQKLDQATEKDALPQKVARYSFSTTESGHTAATRTYTNQKTITTDDGNPKFNSFAEKVTETIIIPTGLIKPLSTLIFRNTQKNCASIEQIFNIQAKLIKVTTELSQK